MAFANAVGFDVEPLLAAESIYAGLYFDQARDGRLVVLLTEADPDLEAEVMERLRPGHMAEFRYVEHS